MEHWHGWMIAAALVALLVIALHHPQLAQLVVERIYSLVKTVLEPTWPAAVIVLGGLLAKVFIAWINRGGHS